MEKRHSVKLVSASFHEQSGSGILEYGVRLAKTLLAQKCNFDFYIHSILKGNILRVPKKLYKSWDTSKDIKVPDIVHYMDPGFIAADAIFRRFRLRKSKVVVTLHDLDMFNKVRGGLKLATKYSNIFAILKKPGPAVLTPFAILIRSFTTKYVINHASKFICVSEKTRDEVIRQFNIIPDRCAVVYPIVGKEFKPARAKKPHSKFVVGHFSSYLPNKNAGALISAFKKTKSKNIELHLYGGALPFKINDDKRIKYFGFFPTQKSPAIFNSFDVFVFPSAWEGFGMPIMEAKRCKIPVITYAGAELPDIVKRNTLQFKNEAHLTRLLEQMAWTNVNVEKAYKDTLHCQENYVAKQMINLYTGLLDEK